MAREEQRGHLRVIYNDLSDLEGLSLEEIYAVLYERNVIKRLEDPDIEAFKASADSGEAEEEWGNDSQVLIPMDVYKALRERHEETDGAVSDQCAAEGEDEENWDGFYREEYANKPFSEVS